MPLKDYALDFVVNMAKYCLGCHKNLAFFLSQDFVLKMAGQLAGLAEGASKLWTRNCPKTRQFRQRILQITMEQFESLRKCLFLRWIPKKLLQQMKEPELLMFRNCSIPSLLTSKSKVSQKLSISKIRLNRFLVLEINLDEFILFYYCLISWILLVWINILAQNCPIFNLFILTNVVKCFNF